MKRKKTKGGDTGCMSFFVRKEKGGKKKTMRLPRQQYQNMDKKTTVGVKAAPKGRTKKSLGQEKKSTQRNPAVRTGQKKNEAKGKKGGTHSPREKEGNLSGKRVVHSENSIGGRKKK